MALLDEVWCPTRPYDLGSRSLTGIALPLESKVVLAAALEPGVSGFQKMREK